MKRKLLVTIVHPAEARSVRETKCEILAEYPNALLVRASAEQEQALRGAGLEFAEVADASVQVSGTRFAFADAIRAEEEAPTAPDPARTAYYIVKLIGPPKGEWLTELTAAGAAVESQLPGFAMLVGMLPAVRTKVEALPWVEGVSPYRAAMKVAPQLRPDATAELAARHLTAFKIPKDGDAQIEISVFPGESTEAVAHQIRTTGGNVFDVTPHVVHAIVPRTSIVDIAAREDVLAIVPHAWAELHNDKAAAVMDAPADRHFQDLSLKGGGQIVAIADTGLDSGDAATVAADFTGRVTQIVSWPNQHPLHSNDAAPYDDGPRDTNPHGTHVAGSVLGSGAAATAAGSTYIPEGMAPEAHVYFQAVEQNVHWKTSAELAAAGLTPFTTPWPPKATLLWGLPESDLRDLFAPPYTAGARLHTNSWGAPANGVYDNRARRVDDFMWNHRDMLILFSAGNDGQDLNKDGVIDPGSIGTPGCAKNCLTVGACENDRPHTSNPKPGYDFPWTDWTNADGTKRWPKLTAAGAISDNPKGMAAFSSRGPTADGRLKPDVVAPGTNILSTRSSAFPAASKPLWGDLPATDPLHGLYCWCGGTSMSTPLVAGAAALVRQHLVEQRGHYQDTVKPSGALLKAFLVNGAISISPGQFTTGGGTPPLPASNEIPPEQNSVDGYGRVDVAAALTPGALKRTLFADDPSYAVESGSMRTFQVQVIDTARPLKATLCWTDAPSIGAGGLVNQLFLRVRRPDGTLVDGDVSAYPTVTNNVQRVVINSPTPGTYEMRVYGVSVTTNAPSVPAIGAPKQDFALVVSNGMGFSLQPVSLAQTIDTTGSMDYFGYMEPAKERATQLVDFLRLNDKLSITEFSQRPGVPNARTGFPLRLLGNFSPDWTDAHAAIDALHSDGCTPIGDGLAEAWNQLRFEPIVRPRGIVLLSDGLNNVPPDPLAVATTILPEVPIFTIALGPAGNTPMLQDIAGSRPGGQYFVVDGDEDIGKLHQIYATLQGLAAGMATVGLSSIQVNPPSDQTTFMVDAHCLEVCFALSWDGAAGELSISAKGPNGKVYKAGSAATLETHGDTYRILRIAAPPEGLWTLTIKPGTKKVLPCTVSAAVRASLALNSSATVIKNQLSVTARIMAGGNPVRGAVVTANVRMPSLSRADALRKYAEELKKLELPPSVLEKGLTREQVNLTRLAALAYKYRGKPEGLFGRVTVPVRFEEVRPGEYRAAVPLKADGNVTIAITGQDPAKKPRWTRVAHMSVFC